MIIRLIVFSLLTFTTAAGVKNDELPRLPEAVLLVGFPPHDLAITSFNKTLKIQDDSKVQDSISPSISADGKIVASARRLTGENSARSTALIVSTYSTLESRWTDHKELEVVVGSIAVSADGTKIACVAKSPDNRPGLLILDLTSGIITRGPEMSERSSSGVSWSPDGHHLTFDMDEGTHSTSSRTRGVYILDVLSGTVAKIAEGRSPSWSPSGEWIAFINGTSPANARANFQVRLAHPEGRGTRILRTFRSDVMPNLKPIWSPDSKQILLNESRNADKNTWNIYRLNAHDGSVNHIFKNKVPVFGWVSEMNPIPAR